ncbi:hypothetical protein ACSDBR_14570 [Acidithiobacillus ferriphilus]|uniref:hypothetical protein n=1 Tax=Acidithiobacillus ferriphilus TaxID=1689834 RepID=UPI001C07D865|nr:hypothetical protein [Acidithiobacillus ferriphilus]MBU2833781.1 hypothetical protein [Acidithiobacillus ferriphilus]
MSTAEQGPEHDCQATQATIAPLLKESEVDKKRHNRFLEELGLAGSDDVIGFPLLNACNQTLPPTTSLQSTAFLRWSASIVTACSTLSHTLPWPFSRSPGVSW